MKFTKTLLFVIITSPLLLTTQAFCAADNAPSIDERYAALPAFFHDRIPGQDRATADGPLFDPKGYLALAAALQKLGKDAAIGKLREFSKRPDSGKVIALCRMLFVAKPDGGFRGPLPGGPSALPRADDNGWPLEPLAIIHGIPFLVTSGHILAGKTESAKKYLDYCVSNCDWQTKRYAPVSANGFGPRIAAQAQLEAAAATLLLRAMPGEKWFDPQWTTFIQRQLESSAAYTDYTEKSDLTRLFEMDGENKHGIENAEIPDASKKSQRPGKSVRENANASSNTAAASGGNFSTRKDALAKLIGPEFGMKALAKNDENVLYALLEIFAQKRRRDEFAYKFFLHSAQSASLYFSDSGMHGGGVIDFKKSGGAWAIEHHSYFL